MLASAISSSFQLDPSAPHLSKHDLVAGPIAHTEKQVFPGGQREIKDW